MDEERGSNYKREERLPWLDVEPLIKDSDMLGLVIAISTVQTAQGNRRSAPGTPECRGRGVGFQCEDRLGALFYGDGHLLAS